MAGKDMGNAEDLGNNADPDNAEDVIHHLVYAVDTLAAALASHDLEVGVRISLEVLDAVGAERVARERRRETFAIVAVAVLLAGLCGWVVWRKSK